MIQNAILTLSLEVILAFTVLQPEQAIAQHPPHYSQRQLRSLIASAANADDYQKLATYFHYQELMFREKAQKVIDEYADHAGKYPMATKTVTRADVATRSYDEYSSKANDNARLARKYDELLIELNVKPASESATIVSLKSLQKASGGMPGSAFSQPPNPKK